jgi:hypothetical protein
MLAYEIMMRSIPVMSQQMSLMYHAFPMDALLMQLGTDGVRELARHNQDQMKNWSNVNPRSMNLVGDLKLLERHYSDYDKLAFLLRQDIAAKSGIPESALFHTQAQGFSNQQAEALRLVGTTVIPQAQALTQILVYSCFGPDSAQAAKAHNVRLSFDSPTVVPDDEKASIGVAFSTMVSSLVTAQFPLDMAVKTAKQFMPDTVHFTDADLERLAADLLPDENMYPDPEQAPVVEETVDEPRTPIAEALNPSRSPLAMAINPDRSAVAEAINPSLTPLQKIVNKVTDWFRGR